MIARASSFVFKQAKAKLILQARADNVFAC
jgi:hypothetical protein